MNSVAQLTDDTPTVSERLVALVREWEADHEGYEAPVTHLCQALHLPKKDVESRVDALALQGILRWTEKRGLGERDVASGPVSQ